MTDSEKILFLTARNEKLSPIVFKGFAKREDLEQHSKKHIEESKEYRKNQQEISRLKWILITPEQQRNKLDNSLRSYDRRSYWQSPEDRLEGWHRILEEATSLMENLERHFHKQDASTTPMDENRYNLEKAILAKHQEAVKDKIEKVRFEMMTPSEQLISQENDPGLPDKVKRWKQEDEER